MISFDSQAHRRAKDQQLINDMLNNLTQKWTLLVIWDKQSTDFIENPFLFASFLEKAQEGIGRN